MNRAHVVVKPAPGSSEEKRYQLAEEIVKDVMRILDRKEEVISVALEEVDPEDWTDKVYIPDIQGKWNLLYKRPGYNPFE